MMQYEYSWVHAEGGRLAADKARAEPRARALSTRLLRVEQPRNSVSGVPPVTFFSMRLASPIVSASESERGQKGSLGAGGHAAQRTALSPPPRPAVPAVQWIKHSQLGVHDAAKLN